MRERDPRAEPARKLYLQGKKLIEIARELDLPEGTVRRWKHVYEWDKPPEEQVGNGRSKTKSVKKQAKQQGKKEKKKKKDETVQQQEPVQGVSEDRAEAFSYEYLKTFNATKAYMAVFGSTYMTANKKGYLYLREPEVQEKIREIKSKDITSKMVSIDDVVKGFVNIAFDEEKPDSIRMKALEWLANRFGYDQPEDENGTGVVMLGEVMEDENNMETAAEAEAVPVET